MVKTSLLATLKNQFIISAESGLLSISKHDIPYCEVKTIDDMNDAYQYALKCKEETICLDSISEIAENILFQLKTAANKKAGHKPDPRPAYMDLADQVGNLIRNFRDIPKKNIVMLSKEIPVYEEDSENIIGYKPMLPGRVLPHGLPYHFDEVLAYQIDRKGKRFFQTSANRKRPAKDRSGNLDLEEYVDKDCKTTLTDLIAKIKGDKK